MEHLFSNKNIKQNGHLNRCPFFCHETSTFKTKQKGFVAQVKGLLNKLMEWVNNLLSGYKSDRLEAQILRNYESELQELSKMWDEMLTKSVETNKTLEVSKSKGTESAVNENGKDVLVQYDDRGNSESDSIKEQLAKHQEELDNMQVIASIDIRKTFKNAKDAYDWAVETLKQSGYKVDRMGFGEIVFDEKRLKNGLQYLKTNPERVAYSLIPKVLKKGAVIGGHPNHKERGYSTVTFAAPVEIDGVRGNMAIVVRMEGKNYYKLHRVLMPNGGLFEYKKESSAETAAATRGVVDTPTDTTFNKRIPQPSEKVKENISNEQNSDRYSTSVYDLMGENEKLKKTNDILRGDINRLKELVKLEKKLTHGKVFKKSSLEAVANHLKKIGTSTIDTKTLMNKLNDEVYSFIVNSTEEDWNREDFWAEVQQRC